MSDTAAVQATELAAYVELKPDARTAPNRRTEAKPKQQSPHAVVLHNERVNRFEWVVGVLQKTFGFGRGKAFLITLRAHCAGRGVVWVGPLEVAEFKAQQLVGAGPDPLKALNGARPLKVTVKPTR